MFVHLNELRKRNTLQFDHIEGKRHIVEWALKGFRTPKIVKSTETQSNPQRPFHFKEIKIRIFLAQKWHRLRKCNGLQLACIKRKDILAKSTQKHSNEHQPFHSKASKTRFLAQNRHHKPLISQRTNNKSNTVHEKSQLDNKEEQKWRKTNTKKKRLGFN